ncbi:hypothetical protein A3A79_01220 [Candidatus Gottesmanbacteria bacterium RIFCSPLOWO2_01_FULL_43_11b]|uniref:Antitoxin n=1 Tax=Candidatus Gottesmanbacteria bacterium RIFCSPLOWO2_01_FULL_43_11b TaxID=1798392 RepID=A0A1F6AGD0_9BACT|nr:MAG: hypothetical protein A3A79_01220 [Candidatus Gottesmanbacteria bacterium RIFCSPLOWO2_01_FULL_43_11b]
MNILPITKARGKLGDLVDKVQGDDYIILTKGGMPKAALVDVAYLAKLQKDLSKLYKKTFIDPVLLPFTRIFSDREIAEWEKNDVL